MKQFKEKLISRLEEESNFFGGEPMGSLQKMYYCKGVEKSIEIVNQLAEEMDVAKNAITNADRIRSMNDMELAELFTKLAWNSEVQTTPLKYLDWLQSEADTKGE